MHYEDTHVDTPTSTSVVGKRLADETGNNAKGSVLGGRAERKVKFKGKNSDQGLKGKKKCGDLANDGP